MNRKPKRIFMVALATIAASAANAALFAPTASATENTWIKMDYSVGADRCITAKSTVLSSGRWDVAVEGCRFGDRNQLWDRRGAEIVKAYTNQCLDSNAAGEVYYMQCNGGNYQKWEYRQDSAGTRARNVATGKYLCAADEFAWDVITQSDGSFRQCAWSFSGGE
ncbi:ricin-type beta-trefoil lectin domain protein [Streptomyces sp. NPDC008159]|uniref:RICIN domain-containing protein n=1 Tax=Streptomyces sp. NPDC008159 TaxID=3364817 RepID=UPI0036E6A3CE